MRSRTAHEQCMGWVDRPLFSRDGASLVFIYRAGRCKAGGASWESSSYLFTVGADGRGLWRCAHSTKLANIACVQVPVRTCSEGLHVPGTGWTGA